MRQFTPYSELNGQAYRGRKHLLSDTATSPNQVIQLQSGVYFERAFFYGIQAASSDGSSFTPNSQSVFMGEKDQSDGKSVYCVDEVTNDPSTPVLIQAPPGGKYCFADFFVRIQSPGDRVFIKYC